MKVALLTREYPPEVYGGAGVHVEYLSRALAGRVDLAVRCWGAPRASPLVAAAYEPWDALPTARQGAALGAMSVGLRMAADVEGVDLVLDLSPLPRFAGSPGKLNQVVLNLLANAIDASTGGAS